MVSSPSSKKMTLKSSDVKVEDAVAVAAAASQPVNDHLDLINKITELILKSSEGKALGVEEAAAAAAALEWQPITSGKIILRSMDGKLFEVEEEVALMSETIKKLDEIDSVVSLPSVSGIVLAKVIEYCNKHVNYQQSDDPVVIEEIKNWDADFVKMDLDTLFYLAAAADYLKLNSLVDLAWRAIGEIQEEKTAEWIRDTFKITNGWPREEDEKLR